MWTLFFELHTGPWRTSGHIMRPDTRAIEAPAAKVVGELPCNTGGIHTRRAASRWLNPSIRTAWRTRPYRSTPFIPPPFARPTKGYLLTDFCSGATGQSGRLSEGLLLRRLQFYPITARKPDFSRCPEVHGAASLLNAPASFRPPALAIRWRRLTPRRAACARPRWRRAGRRRSSGRHGRR